jgi:CheY-like chemotaxis protein
MDKSAKKVILTVDDTAVNLAIIRSILRNMYDVRVCKDGTMAKYMVDHIQVDLALLDINMPVVSGFDLLDYIRSKESRKDLPVIFVTAFANKEFIGKAVTSGALDYIIKPIKPDILNNKIASIFRAQRAAAAAAAAAGNIEPPKVLQPVIKAEEKPIPRRNAPIVEVVD